MIDEMEQHPRTLQIFSSGSARFAVFADEVMTISEWREPAPLPHAPAAVLGVVSIQGRMLTVLDLSHLLEKPHRSKNSSHILALRGDDQLALAITKPGDIIADDEGNFEAATEADGKLIGRVIKHKGDGINVLNLKELFPTAIQGRERRRRRF